MMLKLFVGFFVPQSRDRLLSLKTNPFKFGLFFCFLSSLPPNKVIIKQDHVAENFYFIINGTGK